MNFQSFCGMQWDMAGNTNNGEANLYSGDKNVTVGIIDSGLRYRASNLKNNLLKA